MSATCPNNQTGIGTDEMCHCSPRKIKCAAIRYKGEIYEGDSHCEIGLYMVRSGICPAPYPGGKNQGFVTIYGDFVDREEAYWMAVSCGQIKQGETPVRGKLFSEDLRGIKG